MYSIDIKNNKEIYDYCMHNGITDINKFVQDCFKQGYDIKKYGLLEKTLNEGEKDLIKEVIVEKRVEIPVEVIKEVEKIVEVIKEVPIDRVVEKKVFITDDKQVNELLLKIQELENEMSKKNEEMDNIKQNEKTKLLQQTLQKLRQEILEKNKKIENLEKINQELQNTKQPLKGFFMKGSNINDTL